MGIEVSTVQIKDVEVPEFMQRGNARPDEAERAEGEHRAVAS